MIWHEIVTKHIREISFGFMSEALFKQLYAHGSSVLTASQRRYNRSREVVTSLISMSVSNRELNDLRMNHKFEKITLLHFMKFG